MPTDPRDVQIAAPPCGRCGLPIHQNEVGIEYHGNYTTHLPYRCIELVKLQAVALQAENTRLRDILRRSMAGIKLGRIMGYDGMDALYNEIQSALAAAPAAKQEESE
jgi:hypothetical protein